MITVEQHESVAVLRLDRGVTNALNIDLVRALADTLQTLHQDPDVGAVVLASANDKFFCIGFDIPALLERNREGMGVFYRAINRACLDLYTLPKPTVAAITGHATAGGCILALCCDYRLIAEGRKLMGLNEVKLGVTVPYPADRIVRSLVGTAHARDIMEEGEFYLPEESLRIGLVDEVLPLEDVRAKAIEKAGGLAALPRRAWAWIKRNRIETVEAEIRSRLGEKEEMFLDCWYSDDAQEQLKEAAKKF